MGVGESQRSKTSRGGVDEGETTRIEPSLQFTAVSYGVFGSSRPAEVSSSPASRSRLVLSFLASIFLARVRSAYRASAYYCAGRSLSGSSRGERQPQRRKSRARLRMEDHESATRRAKQRKGRAAEGRNEAARAAPDEARSGPAGSVNGSVGGGWIRRGQQPLLERRKKKG